MSAGIARCAAIVVAIVAATVTAATQEILGETGVKGAGSSFIYPVLSRWSREYRAQLARGGDFPSPNSGLDDAPSTSALSYEPVGSLGGLLRVKDRAVDFAVSDMPLTSSELTMLRLGQFPIVVGGIVVAVNIDGIGPGELRLTGPVLADVFLGRITRWSDPAIQSLNPGVTLPAAGITVVNRADGSGTTFNFAEYLSRVSAEWRAHVGAAMLVRWPIGTSARGNEGIAQTVQRVKNSIGFVEFAQAMRSRLSHAVIQNRAGRFVRPEAATFHAAAAGADWTSAADFRVLLTDSPEENAYPIMATVFVLMPRSISRARTHAALDFFQWSLERGASTATQLGYEPLPATVIKQIKDYWARTFSPGS
jgi:phosphate transport system substrate-binding protein